MERVRELTNDERGLTLVELLVVATVSFLLLAGTGTVLAQSFLQTNRATSRSQTTREAALGLERLARDLRSATAATVTDAGAVATAVVVVPVKAALGSSAPASRTITWTCTDGGACTRRVGAGPDEVVVAGLSAAQFLPVARDGTASTSVANPTYVTLELAQRIRWVGDPGRAPSRSDQRPVTVRTGVDLRNFSA